MCTETNCFISCIYAIKEDKVTIRPQGGDFTKWIIWHVGSVADELRPTFN